MKRIVCLGGGPAGPVFRDPLQEGAAERPDRGLRAQPSRRYVRLGRRLLGQDHGGFPRRRSAHPRRHRRAASIIGTTSTCTCAARGSAAAATASAASRASACSTFLQERAADLGVQQSFQHEVNGAADFRRRGSHRRGRRRQQPAAQRGTPRCSSRTSTCASAASSGSGPSRGSPPSPSRSRTPSTAGFRFTRISSARSCRR